MLRWGRPDDDDDVIFDRMRSDIFDFNRIGVMAREWISTLLQSLGSQLDQFVVKSIPVAGDVQPGTATPTHATGMLYNLLFSASQAGHGSSSLRVVHVDVYGQNATATSWSAGSRAAARMH